MEAQDRFDAASAALEGFDDALRFETRYDGVPRDAVTLAAEKVRAAAISVVVSEVDVARMVKDADDAFELAQRKRAALAHLAAIGVITTDHAPLFDRRSSVSATSIVRFPNYQNGMMVEVLWAVDPTSDHVFAKPASVTETIATWTNAMKDLTSDANAALPA